jgi:hypothetical protein
MEAKQFSELTRNLEAMLHESMVKIGYLKGQAVGIYYTESLLFHLLGIKTGEEEKVNPLLNLLTESLDDVWGKIVWTKEDGRYKFTIPAKGMDYVYEKYKNNHFLSDLVETLRSPSITIDTVLEVFYQYSMEVICEKSTNDEFEYAVRFTDPSIDPFIYCFTFDEMGQYYHRFTEFDYLNLQ